MIRTVTLLALVAASSAFNILDPFGFSIVKDWLPGLSTTFGLNLISSNYYVPVPRSGKQAAKEGWVTVEGPESKEGYEDLKLWVNPKQPNVGMMTDEWGQVGGVQLNMEENKATYHYDPIEQGLTRWSTNFTGKPLIFWTIRIYFVAPGKENRKPADGTKLLQEDYVAYDSLRGEVSRVAANLQNIDSTWNKQNCVPFMGLHYYKNMTKSTVCEGPFDPFFALYDPNTNQCIGLGYMSLGACPNADRYEHPTKSDVEMIVNDGPQCLYNLVGKYGVCTCHVYFIDNPKIIMC